MNEAPPATPSTLGAIALRSMQKRPEDRFQTAGQLSTALQSGKFTPVAMPSQSKLPFKPSKRLLLMSSAAVATSIIAAITMHTIQPEKQLLPSQPESVQDTRSTPRLRDYLISWRDTGYVQYDAKYPSLVDALLSRSDLDKFTLSQACAIKGRIIEERQRNRKDAEDWHRLAIKSANDAKRVNAWAVAELAHLEKRGGRQDRGLEMIHSQLELGSKWGITKDEEILLDRAMINCLTQGPQRESEAQPIYARISELQEPGSFQQAVTLNRQVRNFLTDNYEPHPIEKASAAVRSWKEKYYAMAGDITRDEIKWTEAEIDLAKSKNDKHFQRVAEEINANIDACPNDVPEWVERLQQRDRLRIRLGDLASQRHDFRTAEMLLTKSVDAAHTSNIKDDIDLAQSLLDRARRAQGKH